MVVSELDDSWSALYKVVVSKWQEEPAALRDCVVKWQSASNSKGTLYMNGVSQLIRINVFNNIRKSYINHVYIACLWKCGLEKYKLKLQHNIHK